MDSLYHHHLLSHYKKPFNCDVIEQYTFERLAFNHLCGDQTTVRALLVDHRIMAISILAKGCVISVATASILSEYVKHKSCQELASLNSEAVLKLIGISLGPVRLKCALLSFDAIMQGLRECCYK